MNDVTKGAESAWVGWPIDREIVIARVVDASREVVFRAWTDPAEIVQWFGPDGMSIVTHEIDISVGGAWRFDMIAQDGTRYGNRMEFLRIEHPALLEVFHGEDTDDDPGKFRMLVTFDEQSNGKTVVTLRQLHPSKEQRDNGINFGAVEYGAQTMDKLAEHLLAG